MGTNFMANSWKWDKIYRNKFQFRGKLHDLKEIFLQYVACIWLQLYNKKFLDFTLSIMNRLDETQPAVFYN